MPMPRTLLLEDLEARMIKAVGNRAAAKPKGDGVSQLDERWSRFSELCDWRCKHPFSGSRTQNKTGQQRSNGKDVQVDTYCKDA